MQDAWRMFERGDAGPHHVYTDYLHARTPSPCRLIFFYSWLYIISYSPCDEVTQVASFSTNCLAHRGFTQVVIYSYSFTRHAIGGLCPCHCTILDIDACASLQVM